VRVPDSKRALALAAAALAGHPGRALRVVGVTGTKGKTTTTSLIEGALAKAGRVAGLIGTTGSRVGGVDVASELTTPESTVLQALLARMRDAGATDVAMEVSSIGLVQRRVDGIPFHVAIFTNLGRDHLDFHGTMEEYARAKSRLFRELLRPPGGFPRAILAADDPASARMDAPADRWTFGFGAADLRIADLRMDAGGMVFRLETPLGARELRSPLVGRHNALNLAAAAGACLACGLDPDATVAGLGSVSGVPGRLEAVPNDRGLLVVVDYAHTEESLAAVLSALREVTSGKLWCVFGCGGDRDPGKRPRMGATVARLADAAVVTSDNPRSESPRSIVDAILLGMDSPPAHVEVDRAAAIRWTLAAAKPGDVVLIAGKGHETYQEIAGVKHPFDDRLVAAEALRAL
jgi:UDP-N-acetylmuramoyl-L-alanyl-D-glutamate--2,6-diaminopimelate ligase